VDLKEFYLTLSFDIIVGDTQWRRGHAGAADTGLMKRAEWAEPGSMTDSY